MRMKKQSVQELCEKYAEITNNYDTAIYLVEGDKYVESTIHLYRALKGMKEFVEFANLICKENEDDNWFAIHNAVDAKDYIKQNCSNLKLL